MGKPSVFPFDPQAFVHLGTALLVGVRQCYVWFAISFIFVDALLFRSCARKREKAAGSKGTKPSCHSDQ